MPNALPNPKLDFWFDPASTYSYLSAMRIDGVAAEAGVDVTWRPFLLGPIFKAQGMETSPFSLFPIKGNYMWRDMQRLCADLDLPFAVPQSAGAEGFPRNSLLAARASVVALKQPWGRDFVRGVYTAEFGDWRDIADPAVIADVVKLAGGDAEAVLAEAIADGTKAELRANTEEASSLGIFGAPTFVVGEELFWGNDRLERAVAWAGGTAA